MFLMPYSPRWLENRSRSDEALHSLAKLRGEQEENLLIVKEYTEIREGVEIERYKSISKEKLSLFFLI